LSDESAILPPQPRRAQGGDRRPKSLSASVPVTHCVNRRRIRGLHRRSRRRPVVFEDFFKGRIGVVVCRVEIHQRGTSATVLLPEARHLEPGEGVADERDPVKVKRIQNGHDVIDVVIEAVWTLGG
jgi:hypothetical protein